MNIGVIGLGSIGERHVRNIQKTYPRASIDILTKRKTWTTIGNRTHLIANEKAFFSTKHDVYFITNETHKHASSILKCLTQNPSGIFVEKPLSHDLKTARIIAPALKKQKTVFIVGYCLQFFEPLAVVKKLLNQKSIGKVLFMRVSAGKDVRTWRASDYRQHYSGSEKKGGGAILDLIHEFNYPAWLLNDSLEFVGGIWGNISGLEITSEDMAEGIFRSKKFGVPVSVHVDYLQTPGRRYCEVVGTKGTLVWTRLLVRGSLENEVRIDLAKSSKVLRVKAGGNDMYLKELKSFMRHAQKKDSYTNLTESITDLKNVESLKRRGIHIRPI